MNTLSQVAKLFVTAWLLFVVGALVIIGTNQIIRELQYIITGNCG